MGSSRVNSYKTAQRVLEKNKKKKEEGGGGEGMADKLLDGAVKDIYERLNLTDFFY